VAVLGVAALVLAACGGSGGGSGLPGNPSPSGGNQGVPLSGGGGGSASAHPVATHSVSHPATHPATHAATHPATTAACTLSTIEAVSGESASEAAAQTSGWAILQANGWTVVAPTDQWHLSASDAGADVLAPGGGSQASLETWYSQTPWTEGALANKMLGSVTNIRTICKSPVERSAAGNTQAIEFTGVSAGEQIHSVIVLSLLTPTTSNLYVGETRLAYSPVNLWSPAVAKTLWLIVKRAIEVPQSPGG
jgi:hypothetical protein